MNKKQTVDDAEVTLDYNNEIFCLKVQSEAMNKFYNLELNKYDFMKLVNAIPEFKITWSKKQELTSIPLEIEHKTQSIDVVASVNHEDGNYFMEVLHEHTGNTLVVIKLSPDNLADLFFNNEAVYTTMAYNPD